MIVRVLGDGQYELDNVEADKFTIGRIASKTGFSDPERMRRAFLRNFGEPPQALKRAARVRRVADAAST